MGRREQQHPDYAAGPKASKQQYKVDNFFLETAHVKLIGVHLADTQHQLEICTAAEHCVYEPYLDVR